MAFKLEKFKKYEQNLDDGVEVEVTDPLTKAGTGLFVTLVSYESVRVKNAVRAFTASRTQIRNRAGQMEDKPLSLEEKEKLQRVIELASIVSWRGWDDEAGKPVPCNDKAKNELLDASSDVREQFDEAASNKLGFFTK